MNRKENLNQSDREVIDENKVIENLLNGDAKNEKGEVCSLYVSVTN